MLEISISSGTSSRLDRRASIAITERQTKHGSSRGVAKIGMMVSKAAIQLAGACWPPPWSMWERGLITRQQHGSHRFLSVSSRHMLQCSEYFTLALLFRCTLVRTCQPSSWCGYPNKLPLWNMQRLAPSPHGSCQSSFGGAEHRAPMSNDTQQGEQRPLIQRCGLHGPRPIFSRAR